MSSDPATTGKQDLDQRINFMGLGEEEQQQLARLQPALEEHADAVVASFYRHLLSFDATRKLLSDSETRDRLLALQRDYVLSLAGSEIDQNYVERCLRIGRTHERIGLEPRWVLGAYSRYLSILTPIVLGAGGGQRALEALTKRLFLDAQLLMEAYIESRERDLEFANRELSASQRHLCRDLDVLDGELRQTIRRAQVAGELASTATLAAGLAHEVGSPMNVILGHAEMIEASARDERVRRRAHIIVEQVKRVTQLVQMLLDVARPRTTDTEPVSLQRTVTKALDSLAERLQRSGVSVEPQLGDVPEVAGSPGELEQVFLNLFSNALDAMPGGGHLYVRLERKADAWICATVRDTGSGISQELVARIFDPFFTTKARGHGSGLGLFVVRMILAYHGGSIDVSSEPGSGTSFRILLPARRSG